MTPAHLLLIDDNKDLVTITALLLKQIGYRVSCYYDGPSALAALEDLQPDAILLDIGMSPLNGYEVCRRLRAQPFGRMIPVIGLTGYSGSDSIQQAFDAGFNAYIIKPASLDDLQAVVTQCLHQRTG